MNNKKTLSENDKNKSKTSACANCCYCSQLLSSLDKPLQDKVLYCHVDVRQEGFDAVKNTKYNGICNRYEKIYSEGN